MIATVFFFSNGQVAVCDEHGKQIPTYQGKLRDVREPILRDAPAEAKFRHWLFADVLSKTEFKRFTAAPGEWEPGG